MSDLLARLIEAGTPADLIGEVAMLIAGQQMLEQRRSADRDRQQRHRDNVTSRDVTPCHSDDPLSPAPKEINSNPHPHTPEKQTPRARKGHRLSEDWRPAPLPAEIAAAVASWPVGALERELARFRDWGASATGQNAIKSNWDAAWRNWLRKAHDEGRYLKNDRQHSSFARPSTRQSGETVAARFTAASGGVADLVPRLSPPGRYDPR